VQVHPLAGAQVGGLDAHLAREDLEFSMGSAAPWLPTLTVSTGGVSKAL
jgi:hypothetical protein